MKILEKIIVTVILLFGLTVCSNNKSRQETSLSDIESKNFYSETDTLSEREIIQKLNENEYLNKDLNKFYSDFSNQIDNVLWTDEPPGKLIGVILSLKSEECFFKVELYDIPDSTVCNFERDWKIEVIGTSKINRIQLLKGWEVLFEQNNE